MEQLDQQDEWELSKENVQPLRQGRKFANLSMALQPTSTDQMSKLREQKQHFEMELRTYNGDDPLDVWHRYIQWTEQSFPKGGKGSNLSQILEQCVAKFKDQPEYKNDKRYLEIWLKFTMLCSEPLEIFSFLHDQGIGGQLAMFYEAWAWELEQVGSTKKADAIYTQGIQVAAQPVDQLVKKHREFQARVARKMMTNGGNDEEPMDEQDQRTALGALKGRGKNAVAPVNRAGNARSSGARGGLQLGAAPVKQQMGQKFKVFTDENSDPSVIPPQSGEWVQAPNKSMHKENVRDPGVWKNQKLKQKNVPTIEVGEVSSFAKPTFSVHQDDNVQQPLITPRKLNPEINNQVLSAKKPSKNDDPFYHLQHQPQQDPSQKPMYCKSKVYTGTEEFSLEELRGVAWKEKKKVRQMKEQEESLARKQEELRQQEEMMLKQKEELAKQQQQLLEEKLRVEAMLAKQCQMEVSATSLPRTDSCSSLTSQSSQESLPQLPSIKSNKLCGSSEDFSLHKQNSLQFSGNSTTGDMGNYIPVSNHHPTGDIGNYIPASNHHPTGDIGNYIPVSNHHPTPFNNQPVHNGPMKPLKSCLNSSNLTPSINQSSSNSHMLLSGAPSSGGYGINPTPDSSMLKSLRGTPRSGGSLSAPSPTVNTKEAMQMVMGMFNRTLDIEKNFGWAGQQTVDDFEAEFAGDNDKASAPQFSIFSDPPVDSVPSTSAAPFQIYTDNQPPKDSSSAPFQIFCDNANLEQNGGNQLGKKAPFEIYSENKVDMKKNSDKDTRNTDGNFRGGGINDENKPMGEVKRKGLAPLSGLGLQPDVYECPMPTEDHDMADDVMASNIKPIQDTDMEYDFEGGDLTFMPKFSSTCNFTEAARMASTPFNPGQIAPLPAPPVSTIKSMVPEDSGLTTNHAEASTVNTIEEVPQTTGGSDHSDAVDSITQDNTNRRSSIFTGKQANLSPIMEQSDEDGKSQGCSLGSTTHNYPSVFTANSTQHTSHSAVHPRDPSHVTQLSSVVEESIQNSSEVHDIPKKAPVSNLEGSLKSAQLEGAANMTMHEIDISRYIPPEIDEKTERLLNMSVALDLNDPFDEEKNAKFLSRLQVPLESYGNYHVFKLNMPDIKAGKANALGVNVYNFDSLLGEGAYAKVYKASLIEDADFDLEESDDKVVKVQKPACPWEFYITTQLHSRLGQLSAEYDVRPSVMKVEHCYIYKNGSCLVNDMHQYGTILDLLNLHKKTGLMITEELIVLITIEMLRLTEQMQKVEVIHGDIKPDNFLITSIPDFRETSSIDDLISGSSKVIKLIDFGRSIDLTFYPSGTTFTTKVETSGFQCIEMMTDRPWTFQTDLFGIVGTVHVLLFGEYMKVFSEHNVWRTVQACKRYHFAFDCWRKLFNTFLNIPSCEELPDVGSLREQLESTLRRRLMSDKHKMSFVNYLKRLTNAYFERN